jgi:hypothetical protein
VCAWAANYRDFGLVVIGVHTPEFPFEREVENTREAAGEGIDNELVSVAPDGFEAQADWTNLRSPETYLG